MTTPITEQPKVQVKGYAQANTGVVINPAGESYSNIGATLGGEVNYKNSYIKAEGGAGTALSGKVELGHEFDIGKNMGLDISAKAQATRSRQSKNFTFNASQMDVEINGQNYPNECSAKASVKRNSGETRLGGGVKLNFKSKNVKLGIGVEGGMRKTTTNDVNINLTSNIVLENNIRKTEPLNIHKTESLNIFKDLGQQKGYITPTVSAEVNFGKKSGFSFVANADLHQRQAGIRYTF